MMNELFIRLLNMSLTGSVMIVAVILLRLILRRVPKLISYCLWAVVLFRLLCPVSFSLPVSLLETINAPAASQGTVSYIPENFSTAAETPAEPAAPAFMEGEVNTGISTVLPESAAGTVGRTKDFSERLIEVGYYVWFAGVVLMLLYSVVSLILLVCRLSRAGRLGDYGENPEMGQWFRIYYCQDLPTAFVMGIVRPKIFLPENLTAEEKKYVLLHEKIHIRRGDHVVKILSWLTVCLHWFNPLVWTAFFLSGRDMEMSCDEAVLRKLGSDARKDYSASLLNLAAGKRILGGVPLAFGEGSTGSRIRNVMRYKKTAVGLVCIAVVIAATAAVFLLANPMEEPSPYEPMGMWGTQIENLQWGMSMEEVEAYYTFAGPEEQYSLQSVSRPLEYSQEMYGCEMWITLIFDEYFGLTKVTGRLVDPGKMEQLAANMDDKMGDYVTSFDRDQGMGWSAERISEHYSYEELEEAQLQVYGEILTTELLLNGLYFNRPMVEVALYFQESEEKPTVSVDATAMNRVNELFKAYERELIYRQIAIDDKTLILGMSKEQLIALMGEPDKIEVSGNTDRLSEILIYSRTAQTDLGECQRVALWVDENEHEGLDGQNYIIGLYAVELNFTDMEKEKAIAGLEQYYGSLSDRGVMIGPTLEDPEQPIFFEEYRLSEGMLDEGLYQLAGIPDRLFQLRVLDNPDIPSEQLSYSNGSLLSFRLLGSDEDHQLSLMINGSNLLLKNIVMRSGN